MRLVSIMSDLLIIPGRGGSGPDHWQSDLQRHFPAAQRVEQRDWDNPRLETWAAAIDLAAREAATPPLAVAHSFGCLALVHAILSWRTPLAGAFLIAPADPLRFGLPHGRLARTLHVPSHVLASSNDPWLGVAMAEYLAERWGSRFDVLQGAGHINVASGYGPWPQMREWAARGEIVLEAALAA